MVLVVMGAVCLYSILLLDNIPIEVYKALMDCPTSVATLLHAINEALQSDVVPSDWKDVIVTYVHKKDDVFDLKNYRGISLISHVGKAMEQVIHKRLKEVIYNHPHENPYCIPANQFGFVPGNGGDDAMMVSRHLSASCLAKNIPLYKVFIDFEKAYDRVDRRLLWAILEKRGFPPKFVGLIRGFHDGAMATVRMEGNYLTPFELSRGLKQGSIISPTLFNIFTGAMMEIIHLKFAQCQEGNLDLPLGIVDCVNGDILANNSLDASQHLLSALRKLQYPRNGRPPLRAENLPAIRENDPADDAVNIATSTEEWRRLGSDYGITPIELAALRKHHIETKKNQPRFGQRREAPELRLMRLYEVMYADDIVLLAHTEAAIIAMVTIFDEISTSFGQRINAGKTKVMVVQRHPNGVPNPVIEIRQAARFEAERVKQQQQQQPQANELEANQDDIKKEIIEVVTKFKYLGSVENSAGTMEDELEKRLCAMAYSFSRLRTIVFQNKRLTVRTRLAVYNATILGAGLYGSASWNLSISDLDKLEHANFKYLRRIIPGATWDSPYEKVLTMAATEHGVVLEPIELRIHQRALAMFSKAESRPGKRLVKQIIPWQGDDRRW